MNHAATTRVLELARRACAVEGVRCPHCAGAAVIRWGTFAGRQRYRCKRCSRTFSDFTGTPAAYCKRIDLWIEYAEGMLGAESVRRTAARLRVSPATAFRWRHRMLAGVRQADRNPMTGRIEATELGLRHSEKGARCLPRRARRRGGGGASGNERVIVVFAAMAAVSGGGDVAAGAPAPDDAWSARPARPLCSRRTTEGAAAPAADLAEVAGHRFLTGRMLRQVLLPRLRRPCKLVAPRGPYSAYGSLCKGDRLDYECAPVTRANALRRRYQLWTFGFRGVATRYLAHYLSWFLLLERLPLVGQSAAGLALLATAFTPASRSAPSAK